MSPRPLLDAALAYATRLSWPIFPCQPRDKAPLTAHGFHDATIDAEQITAWWSRWPDANIGFSPGAAKLVVLDVDGPEGRAAAIPLGLFAEPTLAVLTGRAGGVHLYYQHPGFHVSNKPLAPHLDIRAADGYVLLPPSVHPSGALYRWDKAPILAPPPDLIAALKNGSGSAHPIPATPAPSVIPEGQRSDTLTSLAGSMRRRGMTADEIGVALLAVNAARCRPPLPDDEVQAIARGMERYAPAPIRQPPDGADALTHIRDLLAEPDDAVSWIVDGLLPAGGMSVFGGKPKGGKSTTARAIALRVCRGEPVLGRTTTQGSVIYLGLEDPRRVTKGHLRTLGARADDDLYVFTGTRPTEALLWLEGVLAKVDPVLVVVDTLQHLLGVSDLNDYARVVAALGPVLALVRPRRAHMMLVHHAGKGDRTGFDAILGSTAIVGTVDVALLLRRRDDNTRTLATLQRTGDDLPESVLILDAHQEPRIEGTRADYDAKQAGDRVLTWLTTQPEPVTRKAVEEAVEGRAELVRAALYKLVDGGKVTRSGAGAKGAPYLFCVACPVSPDIPGHADTQAKTGDASRDLGTLACPTELGSGACSDTSPDTQIDSDVPPSDPPVAEPVPPRDDTPPPEGGPPPEDDDGADDEPEADLSPAEALDPRLAALGVPEYLVRDLDLELIDPPEAA